jgi:predicted DCC family thiol-disulfide oxidoreductase YuxK
VKINLRIQSPPAKPTLLYDADCRFCSLWVNRWRARTGDSVDYVPYSDPGVPARFPELSAGEMSKAVHLVETDGTVWRAAGGALRALAHNPHDHWLLDWYKHSPAFARASEWVYAFVARHRGAFSTLARLGWGQNLEPSSFLRTRSLFLRLLGCVYLVAFLSLSGQILGLVGGSGILPAQTTMQLLRQEAMGAQIGLDRYHLFPTLCWINASDEFLKIQCLAGIALSVLLVFGIAPAPCLFLLWLIYLSLATVCREFLAFQWDILLLETGFLAIFLAPLRARLRTHGAPPLQGVVLWLFRWLLFRLMFQSGWIKLSSGDPAWRNLSALSFHYETQPLPTWMGYYADHLPLWFHQVSCLVLLGAELLLPFLVFGPRRCRQIACAGFLATQTFILLTGNFAFFNLLAILLSLLLLDDATLRNLAPARWRDRFPVPLPARVPGRLRWPIQVIVPLVIVTVVVSLVQFTSLFRARFPWPRPVLSLAQWVAPFRSVNVYGLFAIMNTTRPEVVIEGSADGGVTWREYGFKYKPGDLKSRPRFVAPFQPRLDWQMWFAPLSPHQRTPWFGNFTFRLLQGKPDVLALMGHNPFPHKPPGHIRAVLYRYEFTPMPVRRNTGAWWTRHRLGIYMPATTVNQRSLNQGGGRDPSPRRRPGP